MFSTESRGQIGIGTLIVFIAMVLVAAIAAGVILNAASQVQDQARETSDDAMGSVSNGFWVDSVIGDTSSGSNQIDTVKIQYSKIPGSDTVDLNKATWVIESNGTTETINTSDSYVSLNSISSIDQPGKLEEKDDVIELSIDLSSSSVDNLDQGSTLRVVSNPPEGTEWTSTYKAPEYIPSEEGSFII